MRRSLFLIPTFKEPAKGAEIPSHRLMLQAGFITQVISGVYTWLPLGVRVLQKIERIVREEQHAVGCQEVLYPLTQPLSLWEKSGRHNAYGKELMTMQDRHDNALLFCPTSEEVAVHSCGPFLSSYKDLPQCFYQIQWKFRDEIRPRFGVMRAREFLMKDAYSFDENYAGALKRYHLMTLAYLRTFQRMGFRCLPVCADSGAIGGGLSHEFVVLCEGGESVVAFSDELGSLVENFENYSPQAVLDNAGVADDKCTPEVLSKWNSQRAIELGHIFYFGTKYSKNIAEIQTRDNVPVPIEMGSYGIGISRVVGALIECFHDEKGIVWPRAVAPFEVCLVGVGLHDEAVLAHAEEVYRVLCAGGVDVLYDDRLGYGMGHKLNDADLVGYPLVIIVGKKTIDGDIEVRDRASGSVQFVPRSGLVAYVQGKEL